MAIVTAQIGSAGGGQLVASLTYDDVTGIIQTLAYTLLSGSGQLVLAGGTFDMTPGTHSRDVSAFNRTLAQRAYGFRWGTV